MKFKKKKWGWVEVKILVNDMFIPRIKMYTCIYTNIRQRYMIYITLSLFFLSFDFALFRFSFTFLNSRG